MITKPFSPELYDVNDDAKELVIQWLSAKGIQAWVNPDQYGIDLLSKDVAFEVEVKHNWNGDTFPFETVHLPGRKIKFANPGSLFVMLNHERTHAMLISGAKVQESEVITKDTIYTKGEQFVEVDVRDCKVVPVAR
jgi:aerobic-type carbon monoxide dehydrogenase small subunit (CoxS/CutS family)